jgi:hypothetical protein
MKPHPVLTRVSLFCGGLWAVAALAQAPGVNSVRGDRMRADIQFLSSDQLEGRRFLERGSEIAAQYIAAEFAKAGLKPAFGDSFLQEFAIIQYRPDTVERRLTLTAGGRERRLEMGRDYNGGGFPRDLDAAGGIVFAGYGITAPEYRYDDYAGLDARGKFVLVIEREPQENDPQSVFNGVGNTMYSNNQAKLRIAQQHGAVGVLVMRSPNRPQQTPQQPRPAGQAGRPAGMRVAPPPSNALADNIVKIPLINVTDALAAELFSAAGKKPAEVQQAIDSALKPASFEVPGTKLAVHLVNSEFRKVTAMNVVGILEGSDPALKNETVVFGGHFDHLGIRNGAVYGGADDDASGTAAVMELARAFAGGPRLKRTLVFAAFDGEEAGLLGSYYYAAHPYGTTRTELNMDMISRDDTPLTPEEAAQRPARDTSNEMFLIGAFYSPELKAILERNAREVGLEINYRYDREATQNVLFRGDSYPFVLDRVPSIWLFSGFTPDYHTPADTVDKLNVAKMEKTARMVYLTAVEVANAPKAPGFLQ